LEIFFKQKDKLLLLFDNQSRADMSTSFDKTEGLVEDI
jgi:hypothetical protein